MVLTDSGGLQEETTVLGVPCITMRDNTERPITCDVGTNTIVGNDPEKIFAAAQVVLDGQWRKRSVPEKWDGHAAGRIVEWLVVKSGGQGSHAGAWECGVGPKQRGRREVKLMPGLTNQW